VVVVRFVVIKKGKELEGDRGEKRSKKMGSL